MLFQFRWHWVWCVLLTVAPAFGQAVSGSLLGTVTDNSDATVPSATVSILEVNTGAARTTDTSESGNYVFPDLAPGTYTVAVTRQGFKKVTRERVEVLVNTSVRVDLTLPLGDVNEVVVVDASAPILQTDRADTGRKIEERQVEDVPLGFNRNLQGLLNLVPGTTRARTDEGSKSRGFCDSPLHTCVRSTCITCTV